VKKRRILSWFVTINILFACSPEPSEKLEIQGTAQGTTYSIIITDPGADVQKAEIDSIFRIFDLALSTYIDQSVVSRINNSTGDLSLRDEKDLFRRCYNLSQEIYRKSNGYFDPSVFPLVKGWGFMSDLKHPLDSTSVDSILQFVSFDFGKYHSVVFDGGNIDFQKTHPSFKLDFNAIAQGLSVDIVDEFLQAKGLKNYYIEVGGEIVARGKNDEGKKWRIGVDTPVKNATTRELENVLHVSDKAIATSGNYRNFYTYEGKEYAHTLDPKTGFPVRHSLLSVTVVADDAGRADAYATLFMVLGTDKALEFIKTHPEEKLSAYFLDADGKGGIRRTFSPGFDVFLTAE
ncbi:MAG: hypothetical protein A3D92_20670, partial [Bacteroidetes bacterium RIFCSPHIGHO2_02_FULL_44_7]